MFKMSEFVILLLLVLLFQIGLALAGLSTEYKKLKAEKDLLLETPQAFTSPTLPEESLKPENQYNAYREERKSLQEKYYQCTENHIKGLAAAAAGALGLSITFLHNISGHKPVHIELVPIAWLLFGTCLGWLAKANNKAKAAFLTGIEIIDNAYFEGKIRDNPFKDESDAWERRARTYFLGWSCYSWYIQYYKRKQQWGARV